MTFSQIFSDAHNSRARSLGNRLLPLERTPTPPNWLGRLAGLLCFVGFVLTLLAIRGF